MKFIWVLLLLAGGLFASSDDSLAIPDSLMIESLDFKDADIRDVLRGLGVKYSINIWMAPEVQGRIPVHFTNLKVKDAISFIVAKYGFSCRSRNGIVEIYRKKEEEPKPAEVQITYQNRQLSLDAKEVDIAAVVRKITAMTNQNIVLAKNVKGNISGNLKDVDLKKGFKALMESNGYAVREDDGILYVSIYGDETSKNSRQARKFALEVKDSLVTFDVVNALVSDIINEIVSQSGINLVSYGQLEGTITAKIEKVDIQDAFQYLLRNTKYIFWRKKGIYFIGDNSMQEMTNSELIQLKHLKADETVELLPKNITTKATIMVIKEHNAIMIMGTYDLISSAKEFIDLIDKPVAQILIEAMVVDFSITKMRNLGVKLFLSQSSVNGTGSIYPKTNLDISKSDISNNLNNWFGIKEVTKLPDKFRTQIEALEHDGVADIASTPQIATLNGNTASIVISKTFYYMIENASIVTGTGSIGQTQTKEIRSIDTKISLSVTPWVTSSNEVTVEIKPVFQIPGVQPNMSMPPNVDTRELISTIRLKDGETYVLGGLVQDVDKEEIDKVPFLGNIPLLGMLFRTKNVTKEKTQLMIFLTPHIYYGSEAAVDKKKYMEGRDSRKWWE
ncbi:MAG: hypothetical protein A2293_12340 [Elusimicrobia bacterium RIFOXYB2_FULL_49_7]|nr:MAG: hypothetical protein A2293_12340 [Elusimicrobia bacterium RIFOXYB2_FULL_49_7]